MTIVIEPITVQPVEVRPVEATPIRVCLICGNDLSTLAGDCGCHLEEYDA